MSTLQATTTKDSYAAVASEFARKLAGKYMTFKLAEEIYGLEILKVRELIGFMQITRVPKAPEWFRGVLNLRGKVIPVVDLRLKFDMPRIEPTDQTVIIVVQYSLRARDVTMGILVDEVLEVLSIDAAQIEPPPALGIGADADFILAIGKAGERVLFLLDIGRILSEAETLEMEGAVAAD
ncbi:MAG TPA: chemotaxis protein CheW [Anaeromyxobacteraceae bacterium]|nr:chemotaxis protein CheW [Anaeromyxobacteraceae bacterium]